MIGRIGDRIVVESEHVGVDARIGVILEVTRYATGPRYLVRWDDGRESLFRPKAGSARIAPELEREAG